MDKLKCMRAFVMTVESGSFAAAAERLALSPQRVAKAVAQLEDELTLNLLLRNTRTHSLTEFGQIYYARCRDILHEVENADSIATQMKSKPEGKLRISAPITFGSTSLLPMICRFLKDYPAINIALELSDSLEQLKDNTSDVAFRIGEIVDPDRIAKKLMPYPLIVCASPAYLASHGIPQHPEALEQHECLLYSWAGATQRNTWPFRRDGKDFSLEVAGRLQVNNSQALLTAALNGQGIMMGPESLVCSYLASGELLALLTAYTPPPRPMHLLYSVEPERRAKIQVFIDAAVRWFAH